MVIPQLRAADIAGLTQRALPMTVARAVRYWRGRRARGLRCLPRAAGRVWLPALAVGVELPPEPHSAARTALEASTTSPAA